jgi:MoaE-MoaD fusion protein
MHVRVRTFAILRELSAGQTDLELAAGARIGDAWRALAARHSGLEPHRDAVLPARNGQAVGWEEQLADGDEIAFLPPVSGGAPQSGLTDGPIDVAALEQIASTRHGAVVSFVGRARDHADDGREVVELEYEAYPEMAERVLRELAAEAEARWPGSRVAVVHRVGVVPLGEAAVAIVAAAPHREEAYAASRHVIEAIKQRLPIWKRERFRDGSEWKRPGA